MNREEEIARNVAAVRERVAVAAARSGRPPSSVTLVAVGKTKPLDDLIAAFRAGVKDFGENRVQEAEGKLPSLPAGAVKHLIGPLQSNKANRAARLFDVVQTVDTAELAHRLDRGASAVGRRLSVFVEINLGAEAAKTGASPQDAERLIEELRALGALDLRGLMAIPPQGETRPHFVALRKLAERLSVKELSMGMSADFETAIEEGSTLVRIGTAIFGAR